MKINTSQLTPGENVLSFSSERDKWVTDLIAKIGTRDYKVSSSLKAELSLTKIEPDYFMRGRLESSVKQECALCAEEFIFPVNQRFEIAFSQMNSRKGLSALKNAAESDELDINFFEGNEIDLSEVIEEQFCLAMPFQSICKESCKGICQKCGVNRNLKACSCTPEVVPNALSVLGEYKL